MILDKDELTPFERYAASMNYARSLLAWPPDLKLYDQYRVITADDGIWQLLPPGELPEPHTQSPEEQREAAFRYVQKRYGSPVYDQHISRETEGSDPLVQEPGP